MSKQKQRGGGTDLLETVSPATSDYDPGDVAADTPDEALASPPPLAFRGDPPPARACVGLPVQFCRSQGSKTEALAGILCRQSQSDPTRWDITVILPGGVAISRRSDVGYSQTPREGFWNLLPE